MTLTLTPDDMSYVIRTMRILTGAARMMRGGGFSTSFRSIWVAGVGRVPIRWSSDAGQYVCDLHEPEVPR